MFSFNPKATDGKQMEPNSFWDPLRCKKQFGTLFWLGLQRWNQSSKIMRELQFFCEVGVNEGIFPLGSHFKIHNTMHMI